MKKLIFLLSFFYVSSSMASDGEYKKLVRSYLKDYPNTVTFHVLKSPELIDWNSSIPNILYTLAKNFYLHKNKSKYALGHISVELNCQGRVAMTGQAAADIKKMSGKLLKEGYGLSLLLTPEERAKNPKLSNLPLVTVPGRLESELELIERYDLMLKKDDGILHFLSYVISEEQCQRAQTFLSQYQNKTKNSDLAGNVYGFGASPDKMEGAGCIAFAGEFFRSLGLWDHYQNFFYNLKVPLKLFGNPEKDLTVSLWKLIITGFQSAQGEMVKLKIPSPSLVYKVIDQAIREESEKFLGNTILQKRVVPTTKRSWHVVVGPQS